MCLVSSDVESLMARFIMSGWSGCFSFVDSHCSDGALMRNERRDTFRSVHKKTRVEIDRL